MYADVYVSYPLDGTFTYKIPDGMVLAPGMRVRINFAGRNMTAYAVNIHDVKPDFKGIKDIISAVDDEPVFDSRLVDLAKFTASAYIGSTGEAMAMALPAGESSNVREKLRRPDTKPYEFTLTGEQQKVHSDIISSIKENLLLHLIFGITGSGKTEVYIETAMHMLKKNKSVIYLVPEISLSSQVFDRLHSVFGDDLVLYHSGLSPNQRLANWKKFYSGKARVAVGTRSAVFMQCPDLGLIVIDEEHDQSYKEHSTPRYNARRIAIHRSRSEGAAVIFGSATPLVESLYSGEKGLIKLHRLEKRYGVSTMPQIEIVKVKGGKSGGGISSRLMLMTKRAIDSGAQAIYLLNRRGFSPIVVCDQCAETINCPECSISLNFHRDGRLVCHYCGYTINMPELCPKCGSSEIIKLGAGTQRVEELIEKTFSGARIFRLDQDSSGKKDTAGSLVSGMNSGEIDILLGTQMVAKGFDFPNVTVVGVLLADIGMNLPDFRASERIFSLLMQVSGRCGRGDSPGRVIIQTLGDDNPMFDYLRNHDYYGFYKNELELRKMASYPPFARLARLLFRGNDEEKTGLASEKLKDLLLSEIKSKKISVSLLGPSPAPLSKIGGNYRFHIILKSSEVDVLRNLISSVRDEIQKSQGLYLEIDIDPYDMM